MLEPVVGSKSVWLVIDEEVIPIYGPACIDPLMYSLIEYTLLGQLIVNVSLGGNLE